MSLRKGDNDNMNIKDKVLEILYANMGKSVSGEEIAEELKISRNSVWKAVNILRSEGIEISSQTNKGYMLSFENDVFSSAAIKKYLYREHNIILMDEVISSNTVAKQYASENAKEGTVVIAKRQTSGRGRMGRTFISNKENGLYMSIILRPDISVQESVYITVMGALAVTKAIEETSNKKCGIKWVNDIFIEEKKVCGILTEASVNFENASLEYAVLGIGVNVVPPKDGFPDEIKDIAGSIFFDAPKGYKVRLCAQIINNFFDLYYNGDKKEYISLYRSKSIIINKNIDIYRGNEIFSGKCIDIDEDANLVVDIGNGILKFNSGEARVRKNES